MKPRHGQRTDRSALSTPLVVAHGEMYIATKVCQSEQQFASVISQRNSAFRSLTQHCAAFPGNHRANTSSAAKCCEVSNSAGTCCSRRLRFRGRRPTEVGCEKQPSFYESAVVEHKAQTHFEGLLFLSDLRCAF